MCTGTSQRARNYCGWFLHFENCLKRKCTVAHNTVRHIFVLPHYLECFYDGFYFGKYVAAYFSYWPWKLLLELEYQMPTSLPVVIFYLSHIQLKCASGTVSDDSHTFSISRGVSRTQYKSQIWAFCRNNWRLSAKSLAFIVSLDTGFLWLYFLQNNFLINRWSKSYECRERYFEYV